MTAEELAAIRKRHEDDNAKSWAIVITNYDVSDWGSRHGFDANDDRASLLTHTDAQAQRIAELERVIVRCRDQFDMYASLHEMKGTEDGLAKAKTNHAFANDCRDALLASGALATAHAEKLQENSCPPRRCDSAGIGGEMGSLSPVATAQAVTLTEEEKVVFRDAKIWVNLQGINPARPMVRQLTDIIDRLTGASTP